MNLPNYILTFVFVSCFLVLLILFILQELKFLQRIRIYIDFMKEINTRSLERVFSNVKKFYNLITKLEKNIQIPFSEFFIKDVI